MLPDGRVATWDEWSREQNVSHETLRRLSIYAELLERWSRRINLVAPGTLADLHDRHILDSAQIIAHIPESARILCDLGSGAGLPGLIIAAFAADARPALRTELVESDRRKAVFLREAVRMMGLTVHVHPMRAEDLPARAADVVTARALAPLSRLVPLARRHLRPGGLAIFPKGVGWEGEIRDATTETALKWSAIPSLTDPAARILVSEGLTDG